MKRILAVILILAACASAQFGRPSLSTIYSIVADSSMWKASGSTRITTQDGKAVYLDSLIVKYTVITYDSVKNSLRVGGLGGTSTPLTVIGNKTSGNLAVFINDKNGSEGDSTVRIDSRGYIGINTPPTYDLHAKRASATGAEVTLSAENTTANGYSSVWLINNTGGSNNSFQMGIGGTSAASPYTNTGYFFTGSNVAAMMFQAMKSNGYIRFGAGSATTEQMRLTSAGKLGLGTTTPLNTLSLVDATSGQGTGLHVVSSQWNKARSTWAAAHDTSSIMQYIDSAGGPRLSMKAVDGDSSSLHDNGSTFSIVSKNQQAFTVGAVSLYWDGTSVQAGNDNKVLGGTNARWQAYWGSDNIYLGGKSQTATMTISGENTIAGQDSSLVLSAASGVPTITAYFGAPSFTNGGRRFYTGADTLLLVNGAKTGRDSTVYIMPDGSINASGSITSGGGVYCGNSSIFSVPNGSGAFCAEDNLYISMDSNNNDADSRVIIFGKNNTMAVTELARLTEAGDFGLGTATVGAKMEINGNKSADTLLIVRNDRIGATYDSAFVVLPTGGHRTTGMYGNNSEQPVTVAAAATTFAITKNNVAVTGDGGGNTVATITGGGPVGLYTFRFIDDKVTITDTEDGSANTIDLSAAFTSSARDILVLYWNGTSWYEASRSVN